MSDIVIDKNHINESIKTHQNGYMVLWTYQNLEIIHLATGLGNSTWKSIEEEDIVRVRIFNESSEHHFWRSGHQLKRRTRIEYPEMKIERKMILKGSIVQQLEHIIKVNQNERMAIKTYHYYQPNELGQVGYVDMRFVNFIKV